MKKTIGAAVLMLILLGISAWNIHFLDGFTNRLEEQIEQSRACWLSGDMDGARDALNSALDDWHGTEIYTHVFIRHAEVDAVTDAFYDAMAALSGDETSAAGCQFDRLEAHLHSIDSMEHVTIKSVF